MIIFASADDFGYFSTGNEKDPIELGPFGDEEESGAIVSVIYETWRLNPGNIDCLFLVAHGNAGVLRLGKPQIGEGGGAPYAKLRNTFTPGGRGIEIHGCGCASSTDLAGIGLRGTASTDPNSKGYRLLKGLASLTGTKVTAPIDSLWGFNPAYSYEGVRTMTVYPSGSCYFENYENPHPYW